MSLEMYIGPMYAGKTTRLIEMYQSQTNPNKIIIDYHDDNQENDVYHSTLHSHNDNLFVPNVYKCKKLSSLYDMNNYKIFSKDVQEYYKAMFENAKHIYINECQFFEDLDIFAKNMMAYNKNVYVYGLDADFLQKKFGKVFDIIPYASKVEKLCGKCANCYKPSIISHRIVSNNQQYLPDANAYIPLCLTCAEVL